MSELWPMSFVERAKGWLDGSDVLLPEHILDYAYPVGSKKRYTAVGWEIWKRIGDYPFGKPNSGVL